MRKTGFRLLAIACLGIACVAAQDRTQTADAVEASHLIVGHPFSAVKFTQHVRILPDGKREFLRNERYPTKIARDAGGRLMMQAIRSDRLASECDHLEQLVPPLCPAWNVFVIDPVAQTVTHWVEGEIAFHGVVDFPLTPERLQDAAESTATMPTLAPEFTEEDGKVGTVDLGERDIEGISAHGVRWTLLYDANQNGQSVHRIRIHEVWTSPEMQLVVRVIDGDPNGEETVWGLKKISLAPDAALFRPPDGYKMQHWHSDHWRGNDSVAADFDYLKSWFEK